MASSCRCWCEGVTPIEVLGVPRAAVLSDQQGDYVYTVDAQNKAQQTRVHLGQSTPTVAAVISGLSEGAGGDYRGHPARAAGDRRAAGAG